MRTLFEYLRSAFIYSCFLQVPPPKAVSVQEILRVAEELVDVLKEESRCTLFARYLCYLVAVPACFLVAVCLYFLLSLFLNSTNYRRSFPSLAGAAVCVLQGLRRLIFCAIHPP